MEPYRRVSVVFLITLGMIALLQMAAWAQDPVRIVSDGTAKYSYVEEAGWDEVGFDDSGWPFVVSPSLGSCGQPNPAPEGEANPIWGENPEEGQTIYVRKTFTLTAATTVNVRIDVDDDYDLYINGVLVGARHDGYSLPDLYTNITLQAGENVIAIVGIDSEYGCQSVLFDIFTPPPPPVNDDIAHAIVIDTVPYETVGNNIGAQTEDEDVECYSMYQSVWYAFTPQENGRYQVRVGPSPEHFPTMAGFPILRVVTGTPGGVLTEEACSPPRSSDRNQALFEARAGTTYYIAVGTFYDRWDGYFMFILERAFELTSRITGGTVNIRTGVPTVNGEVTCNRDSQVSINGSLRQKIDRRTYANAYLEADVACVAGQPTPWTAVGQNDRPFISGLVNVTVSVQGYSCEPNWPCESDNAAIATAIRFKAAR